MRRIPGTVPTLARWPADYGPARSGIGRLMGEGLVLVLVATISAGAGISGSLLAGRQAIRAREQGRHHDQSVRRWEAKRDAYLRLLQAVHRLESRADGAMIAGTGRLTDLELSREVVEAEVEANLYAPPHVWRQVEPLVRAVSLKANALVGGEPGRRARGELAEVGGDTEDGMKALHAAAAEAIRTDLG